MSSFIGSRVFIQLQRGGDLEGKIINIDGNTGSLSIEQDGTGSRITITRGEMADIRILDNAPPPPPLPPSDPAVISYANATAGTSSRSDAKSQTPSMPKHHAKPIPTAPAAMQASFSERGIPKKPSSKKGNRIGTPDLNSAKHIGKAGKGKRSTTNAESDLEEDFDFDKAMKGFDKKKIWEEIRTSDKSDPNLLLVSHNRKNAEGTNGQERLAWDEPVLSPSSPSHSSSSVTSKQNGVSKQVGHSLDMGSIQSELDQVRGKTLQKDLELSKLKDQIREYQAKIFLLESLSGIDISVSDNNKWNVSIYESTNAHVEAKRHAQKGAAYVPKGVLTVSIVTSNDKLRYLGPVEHLSDETLIERLPEQYRENEIGLKPETASLFFRRVRDSIRPDSLA